MTADHAGDRFVCRRHRGEHREFRLSLSVSARHVLSRPRRGRERRRICPLLRSPRSSSGSQEEIAAITAFLASAENGFATGATIEASGGADRFV